MNDSLLILADSIPKDVYNVQTIGVQDVEIETLFNSLNNCSDPSVFLCICPDVKEVFRSLKANIFVIEAAGGVVKNGIGQYLFIFRHGKWDLPKGKIELGEKTKSAARREVEEECGIKVNYLGKKMCKTYHVYELDGGLVLKQTTWYEMGVNKKPLLIPQVEEGIHAAEWVSIDWFYKVRENTYGIIADIIKEL